MRALLEAANVYGCSMRGREQLVCARECQRIDHIDDQEAGVRVVGGVPIRWTEMKRVSHSGVHL